MTRALAPFALLCACWHPPSTQDAPCTEDRDCLEGRLCDLEHVCALDDEAAPVRFPIEGEHGPNLLDPERVEIVAGAASLRAQLSSGAMVEVVLGSAADPPWSVDTGSNVGWMIDGAQQAFTSEVGVVECDVRLELQAGRLTISFRDDSMPPREVTVAARDDSR